MYIYKVHVVFFLSNKLLAGYEVVKNQMKWRNPNNAND